MRTVVFVSSMYVGDAIRKGEISDRVTMFCLILLVAFFVMDFIELVASR